MIAYHGDLKLKEDVLTELRAHRAAGEIVQGCYWDGACGCLVGCITHDAGGWTWPISGALGNS